MEGQGGALSQSDQLISATDLTAAGDLLQSSASRMAEWVLRDPDDLSVPYEVRMAALEAQGAVGDWTKARTGR